MSPGPAPFSSKISICLWFNNQAEEASKFYTELFKSSPGASDALETSVVTTTHYVKGAIQRCQDFEIGSVLTVRVRLAGQPVTLLNGGPLFQFTPAISLMVECADQEEIDHFWQGFSEGIPEREMNCGWVTDRFGVSWQIVPSYIRELAENELHRAKLNRLQVWMMQKLPKKFIIEDLVKVADGEDA